jgi:hypothetical protein
MKRLNVLGGIMSLLLVLALPIIAVAGTKPVPTTEEETFQTQTVKPEEKVPNTTISVRPVSPQAFQLNWLSINGGGAINASSTNYQLGLSVGQSVAGFASSSSYQMGIGFWYGAAGTPACAAAIGDLNGVGGFTAADGVLILNCIFLGNGTGTIDGNCSLCYADVNCDGNLTASDAVLELSRIFLGSTAPPWCGS